MPKFAANLSFLFTEVAFPERFARAAAAGFAGVEYLFPYAYAAPEIAAWLREYRLEQVLFNLSAGEWAAGERGLACLPERRGEFAESVEQAREYAAILDCPRVHCMAGRYPEGAASGACPSGLEAELENTYVANLRHAADRLATVGVTVLIEPINSRLDMPGYWLDDVAKGLRLLEKIDRANVKLQYDLYHAHIMADDSARRLEEQIACLGHVQLADYPGRHEPGTGEINYPLLLDLLDRLGYRGWVGCEYQPLTTTEAGLGWLPK